MDPQCISWQLTVKGAAHLQLISLTPEPCSLDQTSQLLPDGAYTTFRTFHKTAALLLDDHFSRLEQTASLVSMDIHLDRGQLMEGLRQAITAFQGEARIRLTLDLSSRPGDLYISLEHLKVPSPEQYAHGVSVITRQLHRENPKAKVTEFIAQAGEIRKAFNGKIEDALMVGDNGRVLEGLSSNFFAVRSGVVWTADTGVLAGITRSLVLAAITKEEIPLRLEGICAGDLPMIGEAFITSSTRGVLSVTQIDGLRVGQGTPSPLTRQIAQAYQKEIERLIEPMWGPDALIPKTCGVTDPPALVRENPADRHQRLGNSPGS